MVSPLLPAPTSGPRGLRPRPLGEGRHGRPPDLCVSRWPGPGLCWWGRHAHLFASPEASPSSHRARTVNSEGLLQPMSPRSPARVHRPKSQMRHSWWGGAFATAPQLLSHSQASPTPAPVTPACPGCSRAAYPAPRLSPEVVLLPESQQFLLRPGGGCAHLPQRENRVHAHSHPHMPVHTHSLPTRSHPPMRVHTRSPWGAGGEPVKHSVPLLPSPARVYK